VDHDATYWELHLYNSTNLNDKITSYSYVGNDRNQTTTQPVSLSAGTYYVKIDHPYYWSDCIYHFRVNTVLNLSLDSNPIAVGGTTRLNVSNNQGGALSFSSSDTSVATIDSSGKITGKNVGTAKIIVKAAATGNSSAISNSIKIQVVGLGATSKLTVGNASNGIKLGWKKVTGASKYIIYRNNKRIAVVKGNSKVTYTDKSTLKNGAKYTYKIVAASDTTTSKTSKSVTIYRLSNEKQSSVKNKKSRKMIVKYGKNAKATGYQIQYSPSSSFSYGNKTVKVKGAKNSAKTISNLTWGNSYYVRVRAYKSAGGKTFYSAWSSKKKIKISK
ncbi:MAG: fibronectin type III domain-containing protein, partial [Lachnospiraceae bacterium]|nr:fibronectin type III domain-containing protein [Lachnospiraceae bacterium]